MNAEWCPVTEQGKTMAALAYAGFFVGLPLGIVPLLQREDEFAMFHAKPAAAVWLATLLAGIVLFFVHLVLFVLTCGIGALLVWPLFFAVAVWPLVVGVQGLVLALNGRRELPYGTFGLGDLLFGDVQAKPRG